MIDTIDVQPHPGITAEDGFMTAYERQVLATLVRNENVRSVLEIGINEGKTAAVVLAANSVIERYVGVELQWGSQPTLDGWCAETVVSGSSSSHEALST
jgi:hypothetical protein